MSIPTIQGLAGIVTDPEAKTTPSGKPVLTFRLAFNDSKYNDQTRAWDTTKSFYVDASVWEDAAIRLKDQIVKGDQVYVEGRLETQSWEKDGERKSKPALTVRVVRKLQKGDAPQQQQSSPPASNGSWTPDQGQGGWNAPAADPWGQPPAANAGGWG